MGQVVFYDNDILIWDKEAGEDSEKLPELLAAEYGTLFVVHRLDKPVRGLILYARNKASAAVLSRQVTDGGLEKEYMCKAYGHFDEPKGEMADLLFKDRASGKTFVVKRERKGVKQAKLLYEVIGEETNPEGDIISTVRIKLITGRSHQIRVQFGSRKHPLIGDGKYGSRIKGDIELKSVMLRFIHPADGKMREFRSEL